MLYVWQGSRAQPDGTIWQTRILLDSARTGVSSVTVNPLHHELTVTGSGSIDIPSTPYDVGQRYPCSLYGRRVAHSSPERFDRLGRHP